MLSIKQTETPRLQESVLAASRRDRTRWPPEEVRGPGLAQSPEVSWHGGPEPRHGLGCLPGLLPLHPGTSEGRGGRTKTQGDTAARTPPFSVTLILTKESSF